MRRVLAACAAVVVGLPAQFAVMDPAHATSRHTPRPTTITGTVTDNAGHPLRYASVGAYRDFRFIWTHSAADGRFTLHVGAGSYDLDVSGAKASGGNSDATGYGLIRHPVTISAGAHRNAGTFALPKAGAIRGVVTDAGGHPLRNVVVSWQPPSAYLSSDVGPFFDVVYETNTVRTDAQGTYTFKGMGQFGIIPCFDPSQASGGDHDAVGYVRRCATAAAAAARGRFATVPTVALTSSAGATLRGSVTDQAGRPVPDASIDLIKLRSSYQDFANTDRQGRFVATSEPAGRYRVCGESHSPRAGLGLLRTCRTVTLVAGRSTDADVHMRAGGAAAGRIIGPSGRGVPRLDVSLETGSNRLSAEGYSTTNRRGNFTVGGLTTGDYKVCWDANQSVSAGDPTGVQAGCLPHTVHVAVGRIRHGVNATLARGGAIAGRISGVGHQQTYVFVDSPRENSGHSALVGRDGGFRVTDLTPGVAYRVCAETLDIYNDRQVCRSKQVIAKRGGTVHGIDLQFPAETHLRITVTDTAGHRLGGVEVAALLACRGQWCPRQPVFGSRPVTVNGVNVTNARGIGTITPTRGGHFAVCALAYYATVPSATSPTGYADKCTGSTFSITAPRGAVTTVHLVLSAGAIVTGQVVNAHGDPVAGAQMHLPGSPVDDLSADTWSYFTDSYNPGPDVDSVTDAHGRYTIHSVRPGQAKLCARKAAGYQDGCLSGDVTLTGGSTTTAPDLQLTATTPGNRPATQVPAPTKQRTVRRFAVVDGHLVIRPTQR